MAVLSGVGGWAGAVVAGGLDARDPTGAIGFAGAMKDLPEHTTKGGTLYVFSPPLNEATRSMTTRDRDPPDGPPWPALAAAVWRPRASAACAGRRAGRPTPARRVLRVSADPNNLPFTNERREGFENKIAELLAGELDAEIRYVWRAQRRGFFREALKEGEGDLVLGVPAGFERALTTAPYYRSTYVFVSRKDRDLEIRSFDDPALQDAQGRRATDRRRRHQHPAGARAWRPAGWSTTSSGFTVYGDYAEANPPARIVDAVARGDVDVAVVWGPLAGYFAETRGPRPRARPVEPEKDRSGLPDGLRHRAWASARGTRS